jgi:glycerol-3-phosphate acyltransferase PlsX
VADRIVVAIDGMGGDNAPEMIVEGLDIICRQNDDVHFLLFGDEARLRPILANFPAARSLCEVCHTPDAVAGDAKPTTALRSGKSTSMRLAIDAVADGRASAIVSAGNTGALMAMATIVLKTLPGIDRPAIAASLPTQRGEAVMLDLGANVECDAENLVQFAVMGEAFARNELGLAEPVVGILNVGVEVLKGNEAVKGASAILQKSNLPIKFYGFVEGDDIGKGTVDVIVTDGFSGNIALKTAEGAARMFSHYLRQSLMGSVMGRIGALIARGAIGKFRSQFDPRRYNGAMLIGLNGICVKSHGGTDGIGFAHAVDVAINLVRRNLNEVIKQDLERLMNERRVLQSVSG